MAKEASADSEEQKGIVSMVAVAPLSLPRMRASDDCEQADSPDPVCVSSRDVSSVRDAVCMSECEAVVSDSHDSAEVSMTSAPTPVL